MYNHQTLKSEYPQHQEVLLFYKTTPCPTLQHDNDSLRQPSKKVCYQVPCYHYHTIQDMRRNVIDQKSDGLLYDAQYCPSLLEGYECQEGMACGFCHTQNELNYHPLYYKTQPCTECMYPNNPKLCPNYHAEEANRHSLIEKIMMGGFENRSFEDGRTKPNQFNLDMFKVKPCTKKGNHNVKICDYYHHDKDRRRQTNIYSYTPPICSYILQNMMCPNGDNCNYAHNKLEQLYHPERYKRKFCLHYPHNIHKCDYGGHCSFAHHESEIMVELLHNMKQDENFYLNKYKTVFCPYIYEHDRTQCIYAHNPQDLRRDLVRYKYSSNQCPYWMQGQIFCYEEGGCPNGMECPNCHGWKELEYHPMNYKTKPCNNLKKCNKKECPFYHSNADRRQTKATSQLTSQLTRSLLQNNSPPRNFIPQAMFGQQFNDEMGRVQSMSFTPFRFGSDPESNRKGEMKMIRHGGSSQGTTTTHASTVNFGEDDITPGMSYQPGTQMNEFYPGYQSPIKASSASPEKSRFDLGKHIFSPPNNDVWSSFQPDQEDQLEGFFASGSNSLKMAKVNMSPKEEDNVEHEENNQKDNKNEIVKLPSMSNDEFKEAFISNLDKKGLSHTKAYLIHPMIDINALKSFSKKDFHLFPHISVQDKEQIVKIIEDILEVESLLCDVNILNGDEYPLSPELDEGDFFKNIGSWERNQDLKAVSETTR